MDEKNDNNDNYQSPMDTLYSIKEKIFNQLGININLQRII